MMLDGLMILIQVLLTFPPSQVEQLSAGEPHKVCEWVCAASFPGNEAAYSH